MRHLTASTSTSRCLPKNGNLNVVLVFAFRDIFHPLDGVGNDEGGKMRIRNLTPHVVNLFINGEYVAYPPDGPAPRVSERYAEIEGDFPFKAVKV